MTLDTQLRETTPDRLPALDHEALQQRGRRRRLGTRVAGATGVVALVGAVAVASTVLSFDGGLTVDPAAPSGSVPDAEQTVDAAAAGEPVPWDGLTLEQAIDSLRQRLDDHPGRVRADDEQLVITTVGATSDAFVEQEDGELGRRWTSLAVVEMTVAPDGTTTHRGTRAPYDDQAPAQDSDPRLPTSGTGRFANLLTGFRDTEPTDDLPDEFPVSYDVEALLAEAEGLAADGAGWQASQQLVLASAGATDETTMRRILDMLASLDVVTYDGLVLDPLGRRGVAFRLTDPESGLMQQVQLHPTTGYPVAWVDVETSGGQEEIIIGFQALRSVEVEGWSGPEGLDVAETRDWIRRVECDGGRFSTNILVELDQLTGEPLRSTVCEPADPDVAAEWDDLTETLVVDVLHQRVDDHETRPEELAALQVVVDVETGETVRSEPFGPDDVLSVGSVQDPDLDVDEAGYTVETQGFLPTWDRASAHRALDILDNGPWTFIGTGADELGRDVLVFRAPSSDHEVHVDPASGYTSGVVILGQLADLGPSEGVGDTMTEGSPTES